MKHTTQRGFAVYDDFTTMDGDTIAVQESSLATERAVWLRSTHTAPLRKANLTFGTETFIQLSPSDARSLVAALNEFLGEDHEA